MKPQIPWLRVFVEGVVIVGSILLAFGIDAWWEERQEREREAEYLAAIRSELRENLPALDGLLASARRHGRNIDALSSLISENRGEALSIPDSLLASVVSWRTSDVSTSAFDALLASGNLNLLRSAELRRDITLFPTLLSDLREDEEIGKNYVEYVLGPFLAEHGLARSAYANREGHVRPLSDSDSPRTVPSELVEMLAARRVHISYSEAGILGLQAYMAGVIGEIDAELEGR